MQHRAQYKPGDFSLGQVHEFLGAFGRHGGTPDLLQKGIEDASCMSQLVTMLNDGKVGTNIFPITVNYDVRLERMIEDGKYDWKNSDINSKNFPVEGKGTSAVNIELVHLNRNVTSDEAYAELDKQGLRPADLPELLAFGAKYPDKQREFPIVALGSVWRNSNGYRGVPCLHRGGSKRRLGLRWLENGWYAFYCFAAVRKQDK